MTVKHRVLWLSWGEGEIARDQRAAVGENVIEVWGREGQRETRSASQKGFGVIRETHNAELRRHRTGNGSKEHALHTANSVFERKRSISIVPALLSHACHCECERDHRPVRDADV